MKKVLTGLVCAIAFAGLAACEDVDGTTTQGIDPGTDQTAPMDDPATGGDDATQGLDTDPGEGGLAQ